MDNQIQYVTIRRSEFIFNSELDKIQQTFGNRCINDCYESVLGDFGQCKVMGCIQVVYALF